MSNVSINNLNILYIGTNSGTSLDRARTLERIGHRVKLIDPMNFFPTNQIIKNIIYKSIFELGANIYEPYILFKFYHLIKNQYFDVIWNNQCEFIGPTLAKILKKYSNKLVTYINDDPFGQRDKQRFALFRRSLKFYDLTVVVREPNVKEAYNWGAQKVIKVLLTADEITHHPLILTNDDYIKWANEIIFIGTWFPERGPFFSKLIELNLPVIIYGERWYKAREWPILKKIWKGPGLYGKEYVKAIQSAKICLGLLSKGNRDLHTSRSTEIPYIGGLLCAERTQEHLEMYHEDVEAIFWETPEECAKKCKELLEDEEKRKRVALAGHKRCIESQYTNEPTMQKIINQLYS